MEPGDEVSVARAQAISGLNETFCEAVLGALMRAGLMIRLKPNAYVRCRIDARSAANEQTAAKEPATARERLSET